MAKSRPANDSQGLMSVADLRYDKLKNDHELLAGKVKEWEKVAKDYISLTDVDELCAEGRDIYNRATNLLGLPRKVDAVRLSIDMEEFQLPCGSDPDDVDCYLITVTDAKGNMLIDKGKPNDVEEERV